MYEPGTKPGIGVGVGGLGVAGGVLAKTGFSVVFFVVLAGMLIVAGFVCIRAVSLRRRDSSQRHDRPVGKHYAGKH
jgi:hypothetical protein